jgi:hypothetical protein
MTTDRREILSGWKLILVALTFSFSIAHSIPQEGGDTLLVRNPAMVFYRLSGAEYDSLITRMTFTLDSLSSNFAGTYEKISPFLKKSQIEPIITSAKTIVFPKSKSFCFTRQKEKELFGVIFYTPAKSPEVFSGVFTDVELLNRMNAYYFSAEGRSK